MATDEKRVHVYNGEDKEQEDQKMEQFFALIRNFQEARNRRKDALGQREEKITNRKLNKIRRLDDEHSSWVPTFEWADFTKDIEFRRPPIIFPSPNNKKDDKKKQDEDDGLDLKLTL
ncbi:protein NIM1-INTERACTING 1-like [Durio zibethinus]|uniref:Protein NIM1-INTERACTING 1-like n=1 Tax=Durio zibethinus TaxID=66656 RepID=A0A6P5XJU1_DURZI|nr:protein NIM1-INTERACTING 1-like [Durio zibethinus]